MNDRGVSGADTGTHAGDEVDIDFDVDLGLADIDSGASASVHAVDAEGHTLIGLNPDKALPPASNTKLVTAGLALEHLGADYRFDTQVVRTGTVSAGTLDGDLVLLGTGAPDFESGNIETLAATVANGVDRVTGDLVVDGRGFSVERFAPGWTHGDRRHGYGAPSSSIALERNQVTVTVSGSDGDERGNGNEEVSPTVSIKPDTAAVSVDADVHVGREAADEDLVAHTDPESGVIRLRGAIPPTDGGDPVERTVPVSRPERHCGLAFRSALEAKGVVLDGEVRVRIQPDSDGDDETMSRPTDGPTLASVESAPVSELVREMNVPSDNFVGEQLARTVAWSASGEGSWSAWETLVSEHFEALEVDTVRLRDGSGLSRYNLVSARGLVTHLRWAVDKPWSGAFFGSLPTPGEGTLSSRLQDVSVAAKTGTITGSSALSGVVGQADSPEAFFSVIHGGLTRADSTDAREAQDAFVKELIEAISDSETQRE